jgi:hypothetical protein
MDENTRMPESDRIEFRRYSQEKDFLPIGINRNNHHLCVMKKTLQQLNLYTEKQYIRCRKNKENI